MLHQTRLLLVLIVGLLSMQPPPVLSFSVPGGGGGGGGGRPKKASCNNKEMASSPILPPPSTKVVRDLQSSKKTDDDNLDIGEVTLSLSIAFSVAALTLVLPSMVTAAATTPPEDYQQSLFILATTTSTTTSSSLATTDSTSLILQKALNKALGGGLSGSLASLAQLIALGWLRTAMNYQYRYGLSLKETIETLYEEGGVGRFYKGLSIAAIQLPLSRFGDVACNAFALSALDSFEATHALPLVFKTACGSVAAGLWRFLLMPIDAYKTTLQVQGSKGFAQLSSRLKEEGVSALYQGALAQSVATVVGHYPYFLTFQYLSSHIPLPVEDDLLLRLGRNALMGLCASTVSDCCSNSIRVIKTTKQTSETEITYREAVMQVIEADGLSGLFGRGLQTRLIANGLQGALFAVVWKAIERTYFSQAK